MPFCSPFIIIIIITIIIIIIIIIIITFLVFNGVNFWNSAWPKAESKRYNVPLLHRLQLTV